jgi:hypothetical protein
MDALPWHLQMIVFRGIGRDAMRSLGVGPGKLEVPHALREDLGRSLAMRVRAEARARIPIAGTTKAISIHMNVPPYWTTEFTQVIIPYGFVYVVDTAPGEPLIHSINGIHLT